MKIYSVDLEMHYEGFMELWLFLSLEGALAKFEELCAAQESSTSVYVRQSDEGTDHLAGDVLVRSVWEYGERAAKMSEAV